MKTTSVFSILFFCGILSFINIGMAGNPKETLSKISVYAETKESFFLFVNGVKRNSIPQHLIEVNDLKTTTFKLNVVFENTTIAPVSKTLNCKSKNCIYVISKNSKGIFSINPASSILYSTPSLPVKTDSTIKNIKSTLDTIAKTPILPKPSGTTTLAQTDTSKSMVMVNGRPAEASVKVDNSSGKITLATSNDKGEGAKISIDPSKLLNKNQGTGSQVPDVKVGGMTTDEFSTTMDKTGNTVSNELNNNLSTLSDIFSSKPASATSTTTPATSTSNTTATTNAAQQMQVIQKETQASAAAAMERAANPKAVLPGTFTFVSEDGISFTLFIANKQQNTTPLSTVIVNNILDTSIPVKIVFSNSSILPIEKKLLRMGKDCEYSIKQGKKGDYTVKIKKATGALYAE